MGTLVLTTQIKKEPKRLYYCKADAEGNLCVFMADKTPGRKTKAIED